jgi:iron complex transport system permease protein
MVVLMFFTVIMSVAIGSVHISWKNVLSVLFGYDTESTFAKIIFYSRLPRTCAAILAGAALGVSGMIIQTVLNNPLASSNVIGVNSGAGFAVALVCALAPAMQKYTPVVAFLGALVSVLFVMFLSQSMAASKLTVVLAGVAISNLFSAGIDAVVTFAPDALNGVTDFRIGGFEGVTMSQLRPAFWIIVLTMLILMSLSRQLEILSLGSDTAKSLGLAVVPMRVVFLVLAAALAGAAVSFSGLLGFVGLIVPHVMRRLVGEESSILLISTAFGGAIFVTVCDLLARVVVSPFVIPVGIVLSFAGAPFFLWLLFKQRGGRT